MVTTRSAYSAGDFVVLLGGLSMVLAVHTSVGAAVALAIVSRLSVVAITRTVCHGWSMFGGSLIGKG